MNALALRPLFFLLLSSTVLVACGGTTPKNDGGIPVDPNIRGMNVLGSGTDVFGPYAVESNVKGSVLDVPALNAAGLLIYSPDVQESRYEEAEGSTVSEYASSLATSVGLTGSYMFFSAEIKAAYAQDTYRKTGYSYASIIERHWKHSLKVEPGLWTSGARLRPYLTPLARAAIDDSDETRSWSGADVIAAYGTHVMSGIYVGGRLDYHLTIQILDQQYQQSLMTYARASYKSEFASAELTASIDASTREAMDSYNRLTTTNAKGGAAQYANPSNDADYTQWKASLDTNPVFCGVISGGLLPIWELAGTPARQQQLRQAYETYAATQAASFAPLLRKITDLKVIDSGQATSVTLEPGYELLAALDGTTVGGSLSADVWNDLKKANNVYVAYRPEVTADPVGVSEVHVSSSAPAVVDLFFGGTNGTGHDARYGANQPGCLENATVDLNSGTCGSASISRWYSGWCAVWMWNASCGAAGTPLALHYVKQTAETPAIRCLALGDEIAVDQNKPMETRIQHLYWGPGDANADGTRDALDATWVLDHVKWVRAADQSLVNLNYGTQSYHRYNWYDCGFGEGYDDAWIHDANAVEDAQFIGYCLP